MNADRERRTVLYSGRVQGVGFRARTAHLAQRFPVVGYVRNLPNGSVELVVEGSPESVRAFLGAVAGAMAWEIEEAEESAASATGEFDAFNIKA